MVGLERLFLHAASLRVQMHCIVMAAALAAADVRQAAIWAEGETLSAPVNGIERSVIHKGKHLCRGGSAVGILHYKSPLLVLSGLHPVAERLPLHVQRLGGQGLLNPHTLTVRLSVLDKGEQHRHAVAIFRQVVDGECLYRVIKLEGVTADALPQTEDIHEDMCMSVGRAETEDGRMAFVEG